MRDIDEKVYQYTVEFTQEIGKDVDLAALRDGTFRHLQAARKVVTNETLERIGYQHLAVMINTAARYKLSLGEVIMEAIRGGVLPVSGLCATVKSRKEGSQRVPRKPNLRLVK